MKYIVYPGGCLSGHVIVPGDKSISHRALILAAIAKGQTHISNILRAKDCLATLTAIEQLGVKFQETEQGLMIDGVGLKGLRTPEVPLDCGNSGTTMRLLSGLLCGQSFDTSLVGDASLSLRPMARVVDPLKQMGANITGSLQPHQEIYSPLNIKTAERLVGIEYTMPIPSAQVKSSVLLAGLYARGVTRVIESKRSRDHTERMLIQFGADLKTTNISHFNCIELNPSELKACSIHVPNDFSSAAFFIGGAAMQPGSHIEVKQVGINPTRLGALSILRLMGAEIHLKEIQDGSEPMADIEVRGRQLVGIEIPESLVVSAIDEFPILFVAASCAKGTTVFKGLAELRTKESDRILAMSEGLKKIGVKLDLIPDGLIIHGSDIRGGEVDSFGDHRVAMAFSIAGLQAREPIRINRCGAIGTSFPDFRSMSNKLGLCITEEKTIG